MSQWLQDDTNGSWLLILDNADDANMFTYTVDTVPQPTQHKEGEPSHPSVLKFIPQTSNGSVMVTSRNRNAASRIVGNHNIVSVGLMSETESLKLLKAKLGYAPSDLDSLRLIQALGQIPLAITQAAAYISRTGPRMNVTKYLDLFHESEANQSNLLDRDEGDLRRDPQVPNAVITTWQVSFNQILRDSPSAADLLSLMSILNRQGIPESVLRGNGDRLAFEDDLAVLCGFSLIAEELRGGYFEMHRLVQLATWKWLKAHGQMAMWNQEALMMISKAFPVGSYENWVTCAMLLPHVEAVLSCSLLDKDNLLAKASILHNLSWYFWLQGDYQLAKLKIDQAIGIKRMYLAKEDHGLLASMSLCALVLGDQGKYEEAELMQQQMLQLSEKVFGVEHPDTLMNMNNLALVLNRQGKYKEAERMHRQTLQLSEKVLGVEHPNTLISMNNLAGVLNDQGKYEEAEQMHQQTLQLNEKVLGVEHPDTLKSMNNLAGVLNRQGKYEEAERMNRQTLQLSEKVLGVEHPDTLKSMNNLAGVLNRQGKYEEAERMNRQTLQLSEKVLGVEHPDTLKSMNNLALVLNCQGKYEEVEQMHRQTLQLREKVLGIEHPDTLRSMNNLASVLNHQGKYEEAERMNRQTLQLSEKVLGVEHPDTLRSIWWLAYLLHGQRRYDDSSILYQRAYVGFQKMLGLEHPTTLSCSKHYTSMLEDMKRQTTR